jgi:hypothetical protein
VKSAGGGLWELAGDVEEGVASAAGEPAGSAVPLAAGVRVGMVVRVGAIAGEASAWQASSTTISGINQV